MHSQKRRHETAESSSSSATEAARPHKRRRSSTELEDCCPTISRQRVPSPALSDSSSTSTSSSFSQGLLLDQPVEGRVLDDENMTKVSSSHLFFRPFFFEAAPRTGTTTYNEDTLRFVFLTDQNATLDEAWADSSDFSKNDFVRVVG